MISKIIAITLFVLLPSVVFGKQDVLEAKVRTWENKSQKFKVKAKLVKIANNQITLKREDNDQEIKIEISELSISDRDYVADVKRIEDFAMQRKTQEKPRIAQPADSKVVAAQDEEQEESIDQSLVQLREFIDPMMDRMRSPPNPTDTTVKTERKKAEAWQGLKDNLGGRKFSIFAVVKNVSQGEVFYDPFQQLMMNTESAQANRKRLEFENSSFDVEIVRKNHPLNVPDKFRIVAGKMGEELNVGDIIRLKCVTGPKQPSIGKFQLEFRSLSFECSILSISVQNTEAASQIVSQQKDADSKLKPPKYSIKDISREQFKAIFFRMPDANENSFSVIAIDDLKSLFGSPTRSLYIGKTNLWLYSCKDGIVSLKIQDGLGQVIPSDKIMVVDVDDY